MSIVFIGTPQFAVPSLRRLVEAGFEISTVITQPDRPAGRGRQTRGSPVKGAALDMGLPLLQPASLRDEDLLEHLRGLQPQVMAAVAYGQILRPEFLAIAPKGVVNVHPSLLPRYRGASPIQTAIMSGDDVTGVTIMLMDPGMDSGPILAQEDLAIGAEDTGGSMSTKLADVGARLLVDTLPGWLNDSVKPKPQDEARVTLTKLLKKADGLIDWTQTAIEISRQVRAFDPWPGSYTTLLGERLNIWRALPVGNGRVPSPGQVVEIAPGSAELRLAVSTGDGLLELLEVQREGRKRIAAAEFARGIKDLIGSRLG